MKFIGSMTTLPHRLPYLKATVKYILRQINALDVLYINLPYTTSKGEIYKIPLNFWDELRGFSTKVKINRCAKDLGPITKLIPTLRAEPEPSNYIITFDDDTVIHRQTVDVLKKYLEKYPDACVGLSGVCIGDFPFYFQFVIDNDRDHLVDWIQGVHVVAYKREFFDVDELARFGEGTPVARELFSHDDHRISAYLAKKGIPRISIGQNIRKFVFETSAAAGGLSSGKIKLFREHLKIIRCFKRAGYYSRSYRRNRSMVYFACISIMMGLILFMVCRQYHLVIKLSVFLLGAVIGARCVGNTLGLRRYQRILLL